MGYTVVLDAGHGGLIDGVYQTAGKRSPKWGKGVLYEGVSNRDFVKRIIEKLEARKIPYYYITPEQSDVSLGERCRRVQAIYKECKEIWLLSIHSNAGGGTGIEAFTTKGTTKSDVLADMLLDAIADGLPEVKMRYRDADATRHKNKEADFYILRNVTPPAVLAEFMFMDNQSDYDKLFDEEFRDKIATLTADSIEEIYNAR